VFLLSVRIQQVRAVEIIDSAGLPAFDCVNCQTLGVAYQFVLAKH
jgi:hypothetical protein